MHVKILGYNAGSVFEANEIDTHYHYSAVPVPVYCGPGWWYPDYRYGYCPSFGINVVGGVVVHHPLYGNTGRRAPCRLISAMPTSVIRAKKETGPTTFPLLDLFGLVAGARFELATFGL